MCMAGGHQHQIDVKQVPSPPSVNPLNSGGAMNGVSSLSQKGAIPAGAEMMLWQVPTTRQITLDKHGNPHQNGPFNTVTEELPASAATPAVPKIWTKNHGPLTGIPLFGDPTTTPAQLSPLIGTQRTGSTAAVNVASLTGPMLPPLR